ncbi:nucleoside-diphosphate-sugar epimerase [Deinobacterium chartae]|uniref:Nucleoside-diphosphate-sugar epimerase n=1 Tax=Deinobacterium chartae TaxID=521158 RepID=A0A841HVS7_9DEIO|nr:NAD(P)-dependent oxidoreductase [Deinobacterium chartae]MBB6097497.1 nucleoside-diphosphate-sugar epimerase [Deinobacterium chartae]
MHSVAELEAAMATPSEALIEDLRRLDGDLLVLGAAGKMGPTLCQLAQNALNAAGTGRRVTAVSRFSSPGSRDALAAHGIQTLACDLLDDAQIDALPDCENVLFMVGTKFGTSGNPHLTWRNNVYVPARVADRYRASRIVVFSSGNVYPFSRLAHGGTSEETAPDPVGEYAQSVLGRERMFEYAAATYGTRVLQYRLNYAIDLRYGVLHEVARAVWEGRPVNVQMGAVNVIWQGDANEVALRALHHAANPPKILNVTGPETVSVRWLAERFGELLGLPVTLEGTESDTALLSNASQAHELFGYPRVTLREMMRLTADWVRRGGQSAGKPTHFQERQGKF